MSTPSVKESRRSKLADAAEELIASAHESSFDAATFFEKFALLAETEGAIKSIRDTILRLAVSGRLIPQSSEDECAEKLIDRISKSLPSGKAGNPFNTTIECVIESESSFELPSGWAWIPLGHIGIWATGCGFPKTHQGQTAGEYLFCKVSDMNLPGNEVEIKSTVNTIDEDIRQKIRARPNPPGTVIFPKIGGAIATHKRRLVIQPTIIDNNCSGIQPIGLTDNRWLHLLLKSIDLTKYQTGTSVPAVSQSALDPIRIALPPLAEQKRIVGKVDELMGLCDRLEALEAERKERHASLSRAALARFADSPTPTNLQFLFHNSFDVEPERLKEMILTLAVRGSLVEQMDNETAPAAKLDTDKLPDISSEQLPFSIPQTWCWVNVSNVAETRLGKMLDKQKNRGIPMPYLRNTNVHWFRFDLSSIKKMPFEENDLDEFRLKKGDVLICEGGHGIARSAVWNGEIAEMMFQKALHRVRPLKNLDGNFFAYCVRVYEQTGVLQRYYTGAGIPHFTGRSLAKVILPLPPLAEQKRIIAKVDELMALVDQLEQQLAHSHTLGQQLLEAVVAELTKAV